MLKITLMMMFAGATTVTAGQDINAAMTGSCIGGEDPVVVMINREPVSVREYRLVMQRQVAGVYAFFKEHQDLDDHLGYWNESSQPTSPLAKLREAVRNELVRIKVYQGLAKGRNLVKESTFAAFSTELELENARRRAAKSTGQVIYGPSQYTLSSYYYVRVCELAYTLRCTIAKELEASIAEYDIERFFKEDKASFGDSSLADVRQGILAVLCTREAEKRLADLCMSAKVSVNESLLRTLVPRSDPR